MSTIINTVEAPVTPPAADPLDTAIMESLSRIKSVYELIPEMQRTPTEGVQKERAAFSVPDAFLEAAVVAKETATLQAPLEPAKVREVITRGLRFEAVATAAEALARDVRYNAFRERFAVVEDALQVYQLAKAYARKAQGAALVPHVKAMRDALGRTGRRKLAIKKTETEKPKPPTT
jgi:hypothetical protein